MAAFLVGIYSKVWPHIYDWLSERGWKFYMSLAVGIVGATFVWMLLAGENPRRYEIFGIMIAAALALPLEHRYLRYRPGPGSPFSRFFRVLIGAGGIAIFLLWDRSQSEQALLLGTWTAGVATLWSVLGAPALFRAVGIENSPDPLSTGHASSPLLKKGS